MIALLLTAWLNIDVPSCARIAPAQLPPIIVTVEAEGTSYVVANHEVFLTTAGEYRFYRIDSPFLVPRHGYLSQLAYALESNGPEFTAYVEAQQRPICLHPRFHLRA